jgi:inner membrane protein
VDTLTHTVLGACLGEAIAGKKIGKKAMLYGAIANNLPDIDVIAALWTEHAENMLVHRGITHSLLIAFLFSPAIAYAFQKRHPGITIKESLMLWGSGMLIHIFIDAYTSYGTGWFEPFDHRRVTFNALYIVDPVFTLPMLISASGLLILKRHSEKRMRWAKAGLYLSATYLLFVTVNKLYVNSVIRENIKTQNIQCKKFMATPTPLNNFLWYVIVDNGKDFHSGYYSDFDRNKTIAFNLVKKNDSLLIPFKSTKEVIRLIRFSQGYYCLKREGDSSVIFNDMRFGSQGGWFIKDAPYVFRFDITNLNRSSIELQRGRIKAVGSEALKQLWKRMKGN